MTDWISTHEAAQLSGYNVQYIRRLIRNQLLQAEKKGNSWWVDRQSLLEYKQKAEASEDQRHGAKSKTSPE